MENSFNYVGQFEILKNAKEPEYIKNRMIQYSIEDAFEKNLFSFDENDEVDAVNKKKFEKAFSLFQSNNNSGVLGDKVGSGISWLTKPLESVMNPDVRSQYDEFINQNGLTDSEKNKNWGDFILSVAPKSWKKNLAFNSDKDGNIQFGNFDENPHFASDNKYNIDETVKNLVDNGYAGWKVGRGLKSVFNLMEVGGAVAGVVGIGASIVAGAGAVAGVGLGAIGFEGAGLVLSELNLLPASLRLATFGVNAVNTSFMGGIGKDIESDVGKGELVSAGIKAGSLFGGGILGSKVESVAGKMLLNSVAGGLYTSGDVYKGDADMKSVYKNMAIAGVFTGVGEALNVANKKYNLVESEKLIKNNGVDAVDLVANSDLANLYRVDHKTAMEFINNKNNEVTALLGDIYKDINIEKALEQARNLPDGVDFEKAMGEYQKVEDDAKSKIFDELENSFDGKVLKEHIFGDLAKNEDSVFFRDANDTRSDFDILQSFLDVVSKDSDFANQQLEILDGKIKESGMSDGNGKKAVLDLSKQIEGINYGLRNEKLINEKTVIGKLKENFKERQDLSREYVNIQNVNQTKSNNVVSEAREKFNGKDDSEVFKIFKNLSAGVYSEFGYVDEGKPLGYQLSNVVNEIADSVLNRKSGVGEKSFLQILEENNKKTEDSLDNIYRDIGEQFKEVNARFRKKLKLSEADGRIKDEELRAEHEKLASEYKDISERVEVEVVRLKELINKNNKTISELKPVIDSGSKEDGEALLDKVFELKDDNEKLEKEIKKQKSAGYKKRKDIKDKIRELLSNAKNQEVNDIKEMSVKRKAGLKRLSDKKIKNAIQEAIPTKHKNAIELMDSKYGNGFADGVYKVLVDKIQKMSYGNSRKNSLVNHDLMIDYKNELFNDIKDEKDLKRLWEANKEVIKKNGVSFLKNGYSKNQSDFLARELGDRVSKDGIGIRIFKGQTPKTILDLSESRLSAEDMLKEIDNSDKIINDDKLTKLNEALKNVEDKETVSEKIKDIYAGLKYGKIPDGEKINVDDLKKVRLDTSKVGVDIQKDLFSRESNGKPFADLNFEERKIFEDLLSKNNNNNSWIENAYKSFAGANGILSMFGTSFGAVKNVVETAVRGLYLAGSELFDLARMESMQKRRVSLAFKEVNNTGDFADLYKPELSKYGLIRMISHGLGLSYDVVDHGLRSMAQKKLLNEIVLSGGEKEKIDKIFDNIGFVSLPSKRSNMVDAYKRIHDWIVDGNTENISSDDFALMKNHVIENWNVYHTGDGYSFLYSLIGKNRVVTILSPFLKMCSSLIMRNFRLAQNISKDVKIGVNDNGFQILTQMLSFVGVASLVNYLHGKNTDETVKEISSPSFLSKSLMESVYSAVGGKSIFGGKYAFDSLKKIYDAGVNYKEGNISGKDLAGVIATSILPPLSLVTTPSGVASKYSVNKVVNDNKKTKNKEIREKRKKVANP